MIVKVTGFDIYQFMADDVKDSWLKFLNPESLKQNLIRTSLYLTCWEMLKQSVVDQPRDFFSMGWTDDGKQGVSPTYQAEILTLAKDPLIASALWFRKSDAISDDDISMLRKLRDHRNEIAHELPNFLGTIDAEVNMEFFNNIYYLVQKIDKWWIQEFEITTNPEFDNRQFTQEELDAVQSARMIFMRLLIQVANGKEDDIRSLYEEMKKVAESKGK